MAKWRLIGTEQREHFESILEPAEMKKRLEAYQREFGPDFNFRDLIEMDKIRAMSFIAGSINDVPEWMMHEVAKYQNDPTFSSISAMVGKLADTIDEVIL